MLTGGVLTQPHGSWLGFLEPQSAGRRSTPAPQSPAYRSSTIVRLPECARRSGTGCTSRTSHATSTIARERRTFRRTSSGTSLPRLHANFDGQHITASTFNNDILVATGSIANYQYSTNSDGTPQVTLLPGSNVNYAAGGLANPHNYWIPFIQGHVEDNDAHENAFRGDLKYDFAPSSWLDSLKVGVRYADRNQTVRYSTFNWTPIAASWNCNGAGFNADNTTPDPTAACDSNFKGYGAGIFGPYNIGGLYDGKVYPNGSLAFVNNSALTSYNQLMAGLSGAATNSPIPPGYIPICDRPGTIDCFLPSEVMRLEERTKAAYAMLDFGGDDSTIFGGVSVVGNIGVRVVRTTEIGMGSVGFPTADALNLLARVRHTARPEPGRQSELLFDARQSLHSRAAAERRTLTRPRLRTGSPASMSRFGLDQKDFVRFAYSRAISRPDIGLLRNFVQINAPVINTSPDSPYVVYNSPDGRAHSGQRRRLQFRVPGQCRQCRSQARLAADQFDISFERYMGPSSSFTIDGFYKRLTNLIAYGQSLRSFTNNGSTQPFR